MQNTLSPKGTIPLALRLAGRAHQLRETGHEREAFVEAVTAVELAVAYFLDGRLAHLSENAKALAIKQFANTALASKLALVAAIKGQPSPSVLDSALEGIDLRNNIVHEGGEPKDPGRKKLLALLECVKNLLDLDELKNPALLAGNQLTPLTHGGREGLTASINISSS